MSHRFDIYVSYSQIAVFASGLEEPFNSWTDGQVQRGYSLGSKSVSFKTPIESGVCSIEVIERGRDADNPMSSAIEVPFEVPADGRVEIASISDGCLVDVPAGEVTLRYEVVEENLLRLTFICRKQGSEYNIF